MNKLILTDIDEVCLRWHDIFESWARQTYAHLVEQKKDIKDSYHIEEWLGLDKDTTIQAVLDFNNNANWWPWLPAYDDANEYIPRIHKEYGYSFIGITSCDDSNFSFDARMSNLRRCFGTAFTNIHCVGLHASKSKYLNWYKPAIWVEDRPSNAVLGMELGHESYLVTRPHNAGFHHENIIRVNGWNDLYERIKKREDQKI